MYKYIHCRGECHLCGPYGELVFVLLPPQNSVAVMCLECTALYETINDIISGKTFYYKEKRPLAPASVDDIYRYDLGRLVDE